jgi:hypothetical protein
MNRTVASIFWTTCFFCAGFATAALAQSGAPASSDQGCVRTRCFTPSCFHQYAGGYFMRCANGDHPVPRGQEYPQQQQPQKPADTVKEAPPGVALQDVAGDWEVRMGTSGKALAALHLRLSPNGSLTGTLETLLPAPQRVKLEEVNMSGMTVTYKILNGNTKQGTFNSDGQTINGEQGSPTWQRVRTLAQALAEDAKEKPTAPAH